MKQNKLALRICRLSPAYRQMDPESRHNAVSYLAMGLGFAGVRNHWRKYTLAERIENALLGPRIKGVVNG